MSFFNTLKHLLPTGKAWQLTINSSLRRFILGLSQSFDDSKQFIMDVHSDRFPADTRELILWENQFGLGHTGTDDERRARLTSAWAETGGQSPYYLQTRLQEAGFDAYVYDWFDGGGVARDPNLTEGYPLVNALNKTIPTFAVYCSFIDDTFTCGSPDAICGAKGSSNAIRKVQYDLSGLTTTQYQSVNYVGGPTYGERALIPAERRTEFELMVYKLFPQYQWTVALVDYYAVLDLDNATFNYERFDPDAATTPVDIQWSPTGNKAYILDSTTNKVFQYTTEVESQITQLLATPKEFDFTTEDPDIRAIAWKYDGTQLYALGASKLYVYDLSTPWQVDTIAYNSTSLLSGQVSDGVSVSISRDGDVLFVLDKTAKVIKQFSVIAPWDFSTITYDGERSVSSYDSVPTGIDFSLDGEYMYLVGQTNKLVRKFSLSTVWDVVGFVSLQVDELDISNESTAPECVTIIPSGTKIHICDTDIIQYNIAI